MKIKDVNVIASYKVETEDGEFFERRGAFNWYEWKGESLEPVFSKNEALETLFQSTSVFAKGLHQVSL
jgi:hypothetical protein